MFANSVLTAAGWTIMLVACGTVTAVTVWCFVRVLTWPRDPGERHD
jgi:hypothetical protein